ncbi:BON domain-containing protein [Micromonospora krabiensis]|uniref:BON domain-containing protein n=1 Tax=Micromonospora krabiensis TaxID=307121 RepID=A0A1C3MZE0_9ACTN|nr:BON domain-containing protein [Micromonospora krabiensis]SBV25702.1 BON domain-containing protein [Micromonospora krabiensis]
MTLPWPYPDESHFGPADDPDPLEEDVRLAALVAQRICVDWHTRRQQITVTVQNRVVILTGTVGSPGAREAAGELAWDVPGVFDVCNALWLSARHGRAR